MKNFKCLIIILALFLISGCSITSNVKVDQYGKVSEKVVFSELTSNLGSTKQIARKAIESTINNYSKALDLRGYSYSISDNTEMNKVTFNNKFKNICEYIENTVFTQYLYKHIQCNETSDYYEIKNVTEHIDYCSDCSDWPRLNDVKLNISLPVSALENDADEVSNNTYTWKFDEYTPSNKTIYLKISKKDIKKSEIKLKQKISAQKKIRTFIKLSVVLILIIVVILIIRYFAKKHGKNNIDY